MNTRLLRVTLAFMLALSTAQPCFAAKQENKNEALYDACVARSYNLVAKLLRSGVSPNAKNKGGFTMLMGAADGGDTRIIALLLKKGANINAVYTADNPEGDYKGWRAIDMAASDGGDEAFLFLIKKGAKWQDRTIWLLDKATGYHQSRVVTYLLSKGANANVPMVDTAGLDALDVAATNCSTGNSPLYLAILKAMLNAGANPNIVQHYNVLQHTYQVTPLSLVFSNLNTGHDDPQAFLLLLKHNADPNVQLINESVVADNISSSTMTPLMKASSFGVAEWVQALLEHGARVDTTDEHGKTALMYAVESGDARTVRVLLKYDAQTAIAANNGATALSIAQAGGNANIIALISGAGAATQGASHLSAQAIYERVMPSVFTVYTEAKDGSVMQGTGFMAMGDGKAVTAWHVVKNAKRVAANFSDGTAFYSAGLIDKDEAKDIALISLVVTGQHPALVLSTTDAAVGAKAYVVSAPVGLDFTISDGLISQVRDISRTRLYQFTCPVSHGSSGGPVLDEEGHLVGIVLEQVEEGQNLNFALPSSYLAGLNTSQLLQVYNTNDPK